MYSPIIQNLINQFAKLPGIGPKTAERLVFHFLRQPQTVLHQFGEAVDHLKGNIKICGQCFNFGETDPCLICADSRRDPKIVCVVAKPQDIFAIEKTDFKGLFHLLGGYINSLDNILPTDLRIAELLERIKNRQVAEIILALNPDLPGETTTLYLLKLLKQFPHLKITRLARGLPTGADLEYADELTLENAIKNRQSLAG